MRGCFDRVAAHGDPERPAGTDGAQLLGDAAFAELAGFIGEQAQVNHFATLEHPPAVTFVDVGEVIAYNGMRFLIEDRMHGLYDPASGTIHLVRPWTPLSIRAQGVLRPELVHDARHATGPYACAEATEWQAHVVQDAWLAAHGLMSGFDFNKIAEGALCPRRLLDRGATA